MAKAPATQFYVKDHLSDTELGKASFFARGVWFDLVCQMWLSTPRGEITGTIDEFCRLLGTTHEEFEIFLGELESCKFGDLEGFCQTVTDRHKKITVRCRRMAREEKARISNTKRQKRFREKPRNARDNAEVTPPSASASATAKNNGLESANADSEKSAEKQADFSAGPPDEKLASAPPEKSTSRTASSGKVEGDEGTGEDAPPKCPPCQQKKIRALFNELFPELPRADAWTAQNGKDLGQRWKEDPARQNLDWWRVFFLQRIRASDFLMGKSGGTFRASLGWVVKAGNMAKILNGNFVNRGKPKGVRTDDFADKNYGTGTTPDWFREQ